MQTLARRRTCTILTHACVHARASRPHTSTLVQIVVRASSDPLARVRWHARSHTSTRTHACERFCIRARLCALSVGSCVRVHRSDAREHALQQARCPGPPLPICPNALALPVPSPLFFKSRSHLLKKKHRVARLQ
eukprot:1553851-Pleurochrysis_carterae.AAC.4